MYLAFGLDPKRNPTAVRPATVETAKSAAATFLRYVRVQAAELPVSQSA
jgi:hypothetical protein